MNKPWVDYENDLNAMTDEEIERECRISTEALEEAESWLEAVAAWREAGSPRRVEEKPKRRRHVRRTPEGLAA